MRGVEGPSVLQRRRNILIIYRRGTKVRIKSFEAIVINEIIENKKLIGLRVSSDNAFWSVVPVTRVEII